MDKIKHLRNSLIAAAGSAMRFKNVEDNGTCNFDTLVIFLKDFTDVEVKKAFEGTPFRAYFNHDGSIEIFGIYSGIGFRRTTMAEAIRDSLKENGYTAYVRYQMD